MYAQILLIIQHIMSFIHNRKILSQFGRCWPWYANHIYSSYTFANNQMSLTLYRSFECVTTLPISILLRNSTHSVMNGWWRRIWVGWTLKTEQSQSCFEAEWLSKCPKARPLNSQPWISMIYPSICLNTSSCFSQRIFETFYRVTLLRTLLSSCLAL